ncbi:MAG: glucose 1-dehydrogenase [Candidatus Heimdallarchaeota archaeon]|nr:glucose 1-dehydrogenase [Candidatus Heimdallarchaeota archaeon]MDH5644587.1 glucose 1-dehydrogenase [Candidatus Heimdallarchaeota archaeon]
MDYFNFSDKVAVITGASRGIGKAIAKAFAAKGATVILVSRKQESLDSVADEITQAGGKALAIATHTGDEIAVNQLIDEVKKQYGGVDILVNNAGTNPHFGPLLTSEKSHWQKTIDVNLFGYFSMIKACYPSMKERGGGKIINIASVAGLEPQPLMGVYCISKAGVVMMTKTLAGELAEKNIQVNAVCPGFVKTKFTTVLWTEEDYYNQIIADIPQKRMAEPDEIVSSVLYLASSYSSFTTGAILTVDGGQLVGNPRKLKG